MSEKIKRRSQKSRGKTWDNKFNLNEDVRPGAVAILGVSYRGGEDFFPSRTGSLPALIRHFINEAVIIMAMLGLSSVKPALFLFTLKFWAPWNEVVLQDWAALLNSLTWPTAALPLLYLRQQYISVPAHSTELLFTMPCVN